MKRMLVSAALETDIVSKKQEAPRRQGWHDLKLGHLYGDVESVTFTEYDVADKFGEIVKGECREKSVYKFNLKGDVVEMAVYNGDGSLKEKKVYKYDSQGNEVEWAKYNGDGSLDRKNIYKYDSQGNEIEFAVYNCDDSLRSKYLYKYDSQGNRIEEVHYKSAIMIPSYMTERIIVYRK